MEVSTESGDKMVTVMFGADQSKISTFRKFFLEKQQKY